LFVPKYSRECENLGGFDELSSRATRLQFQADFTSREFTEAKLSAYTEKKNFAVIKLSSLFCIFYVKAITLRYYN